jgi:hypothetical protein
MSGVGNVTIDTILEVGTPVLVTVLGLFWAQQKKIFSLELGAVKKTAEDAAEAAKAARTLADGNKDALHKEEIERERLDSRLKAAEQDAAQTVRVDEFNLRMGVQDRADDKTLDELKELRRDLRALDARKQSVGSFPATQDPRAEPRSDPPSGTQAPKLPPMRPREPSVTGRRGGGE